MIEKKYLTIDEAADYLRISKATLYKATHEKRIKYYRPNQGKTVFTIEDLDNYIKGIAA